VTVLRGSAVEHLPNRYRDACLGVARRLEAEAEFVAAGHGHPLDGALRDLELGWVASSRAHEGAMEELYGISCEIRRAWDCEVDEARGVGLRQQEEIDSDDHAQVWKTTFRSPIGGQGW
jgi:hypothetical protein